jgi:hypothetical protein
MESPLNARGSLPATCMAGEKPIAGSLTVPAQNRAAQEIEDIVGLLSEIFLDKDIFRHYISWSGKHRATRCGPGAGFLLPSGKEVYGR